MTMQSAAKVETGCCPQFDPQPWDGKEINWQNKLFVKDSVCSFVHIPLNFGSVVKRNMKKIEAAKAVVPQYLMLSDEKSLWGSDLYIAVDNEVPGARIEKISGKFLTKVFYGPYSDAGKWSKDMQAYVLSKGLQLKKLYFWYTTCPKCAKIYGKNYTVLFALV